MTNNVKALLAWLLGIVGGIVFLVIEKEDKLVRLHAAQSIVAGGSYFILSIVIGILDISALTYLLRIAYLVLTILGVVRAYHGEMYKFPVIGDMATSMFLKESVVGNASTTTTTETAKKPVVEEAQKSENEFELGTDEKDEEVK